MLFNRRFLLSLPLLLLMLSMSMFRTAAQAQVVISVAVPEFVESLVRDNLIKPFEAENPDIKVNIVNADSPNYDNDTEAYLDAMQDYVSAADLVLVNEANLNPVVTRAGFFLDLNPVIRADADFNVDDFYPQMWQSFQWDGSQWAIPVAADLTTLIYVPEAFDNAGLTYPDEFWTLADFENAIRALSEFDETGAVSKQGFANFSETATTSLLLSLAGVGTYDPTQFEGVPDFSNANLETALTDYKELQDTGLLNPSSSGDFDLSVPMLIGQTLIATANIPGLDVERALAPLPGGHAGLNVNGIAISAGSQYPEQAYRLIEYASTSPSVTTAFLSALPARRSLVGVEADIEGNSLLTSVLTGPSPEMIPQLEALLEVSFPGNEILFASYITDALIKMGTDNVDARTALQEVQIDAVNAIQMGADRRADTVINVATPPPDIAAAAPAGEVAFRFGIQGFGAGIPNQNEWDAVVEAFVANDPLVGAIELDAINILGDNDLNTITETYDCFYQSSNIVPSADLSLLLPLDPLINSDFTFDASDIVGGAMEQMRRENQIWGVPLHVSPQVLYYNPTIFSEYGAFPPFPGWTTADFENAVRTIKFSPDDPAPFVSRDPGTATHLLLLMAAYGGVPMDYSTSPLTINFTDPAVEEAIRQVLTLARDGYIEYTPLSETQTAFNLVGSDEVVAMYSQLLGGFAFFGGSDDDYERSLFPQGVNYTALAYDVGAGHVSANTQVAEGCYRFISHLRTQPQLFGSMPILRSLINSPDLAASQGETAAEFYNAFDALMQNSNAIVFPSGFNLNSGGELFAITWLYRVFDKFVEDENTDLAFELSEAQLFADSYLECIAQIPPEDLQGGDFIASYRLYRECAIKIDPTAETMFPSF